MSKPDVNGRTYCSSLKLLHVVSRPAIRLHAVVRLHAVLACLASGLGHFFDWMWMPRNRLVGNRRQVEDTAREKPQGPAVAPDMAAMRLIIIIVLLMLDMLVVLVSLRYKT